MQLRPSTPLSGILQSRPRARLILVLLAVVSALIAVFPPAVSAQESLEVAVGFGGRHRSGSDMIVQVEVGAERLITGSLVISGNDLGRSTTVVLPVEVAGGTSKRFVAVLPSIYQWEASATARLIEQGEATASATGRANPAGGDELVGVLPSLAADMPATAELTVPLGVARFFPIEQAILDAGPGAIDSLDAIVATARDLEALSPAGRRTLRDWVAVGGSLHVDESTGPLAGFDEVTTGQPTLIGYGQVTLLGGVLTGEEWDGVLPPTPLRQDAQGGPGAELTGDVSWIGGPLANSLAQDAGFGLPSLGLVLPLMAIYTLVAGPVAWFVLRRTGRSQLLWLALPALALFFTLLVWFVGSAMRDSTTDAHATVVDIRDGTAMAESTILSSSRNGGTIGLDLDPGWWPISNGDSQRFGPTGNATTTVLPSLEGTRLQAALDAGEFALFSGSGSVTGYDDAIEVIASATENGTVTGSITNNTDVDLEEVAVFAGTAGQNVGTIPAGETIEFVLRRTEQDPRFGEPVEFTVWNNALQGSQFGPFGGGSGNSELSAVNIDLWSSYVNSHVGRLRPIGELTVAAWTDDLSAPMGDNVSSGRTLLVAHADVEVGDDLTDLSNTRYLLRGPDQGDDPNVFGPGGFGGEFIVSSVWRFDVPAKIDTTTLALRLPSSIKSLELWNGDEWLEFAAETGGLYTLPPGVIVDGSVYVRPFINFDRSALMGRDFTLQTVTADQKVSVLPVESDSDEDGQ